VENIVIALVGGGAGAVLTTFMRNRHEREERFRERMLAAADDYSTGVVQALLKLNAARQSVATWLLVDDAPRSVNRPDDVTGAIAAADELVDVVHSRLARVQLLFGESSLAGEAAGEALVKMRATLGTLREIPSTNLAVARIEFEAAAKGHAKFNREALAAMRRNEWAWRARVAIQHPLVRRSLLGQLFRRHQTTKANAGDDTPD
jgi:hypothetical protein